MESSSFVDTIWWVILFCGPCSFGDMKNYKFWQTLLFSEAKKNAKNANINRTLNLVDLQYAPIFDGRLLLGMSLFSKKYSIFYRAYDKIIR